MAGKRGADGFTLIELLVTIAVIALLAGILIVGMKAIFGGSQGNDTRVMLKNASGMLSELEAAGPLRTPSQWYWPAGGPLSAGTSKRDFWKVPQVDGSDNPLPVQAPRSFSAFPADRTGSVAVANTAIAMSYIQSNTRNQDVMKAMPASKMLKLPDNPVSGQTTTVDESRYPVLLDGWNNPIIFVPASGLGTVGATMTSDGVAPAGAVGLQALKAGQPTLIITSPDKRPFFASAGPDGNFSTGDDNIYSFD